MSLEDQVARLANAVAMHDDVAVREIIRQRDEATKNAAYWRDRWGRADKWNDEQSKMRYQLERKNAALRGVITKMRKRA